LCRSAFWEALVARLELSLSEHTSPVDESPELIVPEAPHTLDRWITAATDAFEPCLVLNEVDEVVAVSPAATSLLGFANPDALLGRSLVAGPVRLLDFNQKPQTLPQGEMEKTPPVLARTTGRLARGLIRVHSLGSTVTVDAVATPLHDTNGNVVGSLTFFATI
jgi:hypothetical protein